MTRKIFGFIGKNRTVITYVALAAIMIIGLYCRVLFALNIEYSNWHMGTQYTHDEYNYLNMVRDILDGKGYGYWEGRDAYVTPGYPLFMALIMSLSGTGASGVLAVKLVQAVLSAASSGLVFLLCLKLLKNRGAGVVAAALISFYPPLILYSRYLLTETIYIFFIVLYFIIQVHALERKSRIFHAIAGALFAVTVLIRPMIFVLLPLPYVYTFILSKDGGERRMIIINFVYFISAFVLVMLPWWVRNMLTLNRFIPLSTQGNPFYAGVIRDYSTLPQSGSEVADGFRLLLSELRHRPFETLEWFTIGKLEVLFLNPDYILPAGYSYFKGIVGPMHMYIVALGSLGLAGGLIAGKLRMISIYVLLYIMLSLLFIPTGRFGLQYMPFLAIFTAYLLFKFFSISKGKPESCDMI